MYEYSVYASIFNNITIGFYVKYLKNKKNTLYLENDSCCPDFG